ncbi:gluconokinase [Stenomitos frigidus]|uniref:Gluconokinase n=1 Tax=Stenomitos frigidus ULC18 TaxID=2107698 RepID=A0A2T1DXB5_9CYAN|nr:gluconokinase [Stenomitos frigidus]PSB25081.1 gluconate kinase [Stenomitos frigidus ULC18]
MIILIMGVSGSGKTTIGKQLAETLHWQFQDADSFHPAANVEKMRSGLPLTDTDRMPWLLALQQAIAIWLQTQTNTVLACSALKAEYRHMLSQASQVKQVYLKGSFALIQQRLQKRQGHYMKAALLQSQFGALEEPTEAFWVNIDQSPEAIVSQIRKALHV